MMLIMWFSGLRGAIAYALSLHLEFDEDTRKVLVTTTLVVVLFTTIGLGGSTMPFMKYLETRQPRRNRYQTLTSAFGQLEKNLFFRRGRRKEITLSKTKELGATIDSEHLSEITEEELETTSMRVQGPQGTSGRSTVKGFLFYDLKYIRPLMTRK